jgi:hypothetical protein
MRNSSTRKDAILQVYQKHGGSMTLRRLTQLCFEACVWDEDERGDAPQ